MAKHIKDYPTILNLSFQPHFPSHRRQRQRLGERRTAYCRRRSGL